MSGINGSRGFVVVIILCLYVVALWLVFSRFKLVHWGWLSGTISVLIGVFILATFLALFNYLTPAGKVTVTGKVIEVTPNVTGQIVAIPVKTNVPVKTGDVLFQIDPAPFRYKVAQLQASLAAARQQTQILKSNYEQTTANVAGLTAQLKYNTKRLADIQTLATEGANTEFREQDTQVQFETVTAQLSAAKATQQSAKLAMDSEIGGVNTSVAQIQAMQALSDCSRLFLSGSALIRRTCSHAPILGCGSARCCNTRSPPRHSAYSVTASIGIRTTALVDGSRA
jgi:multidrug resistance efflux pump